MEHLSKSAFLRKKITFVIEIEQNRRRTSKWIYKKVDWFQNEMGSYKILTFIVNVKNKFTYVRFSAEKDGVMSDYYFKG